MLSTETIFDSTNSFEEKALQIFKYQKSHNPIYKTFCNTLGINEVKSVQEIPLLPIEAFKEVDIITAGNNSTFSIQHLTLFKSSGTSGMKRSRHYLLNPDIYRQSILRGMKQFYDLDEFVIWAYTPGYAENPHSSLIQMLKILIENDDSVMSRFLDLNSPLVESEIEKVKKAGKKLMLFGAAFGLLDLLDLKSVQLPKKSAIIETGGMKTFRREISKEDLHQKLAEGFGLPKNQIHSEYGMAELLSQAYSQGDDWFRCVPWMNVSIRNPENPMEVMPFGEEGLIGVMDLANVYSCSFILTGDKGIQREDGAFQVLGRWSPTNLRGCNFLIDH